MFNGIIFFKGIVQKVQKRPNGINIFDYGWDGCQAAFNIYEYTCPDSKWEVFTYGLRSHCNHSTHTSDNVFTSNLVNVGGVSGVQFNQRSDDCGDPNEMTIMAACRIIGTPAPDPNVWNSAFRNVNWTN